MQPIFKAQPGGKMWIVRRSIPNPSRWVVANPVVYAIRFGEDFCIYYWLYGKREKEMYVENEDVFVNSTQARKEAKFRNEEYNGKFFTERKKEISDGE